MRAATECVRALWHLQQRGQARAATGSVLYTSQLLTEANALRQQPQRVTHHAQPLQHGLVHPSGRRPRACNHHFTAPALNTSATIMPCALDAALQLLPNAV